MSHSPSSETEARESYESGWGQILDLINSGGSWSGHERNCCFFNLDGSRFANASAVAGLDFLDDGRCVAPVDWDLDGDLDLWLSARTGPRLRFVRNDIRSDERDADESHFLAVKLVGKSCNRDAIGAQVEVTSNGTRLVRNLRAGDGYLAQASKWIHFGLGNATSIERLTVRWPGGEIEEFRGVRSDTRFELIQGSGQATEWNSPNRLVALTPSQLKTQSNSTPKRLVLFDRIPLPTLRYKDFEDQEVSVRADTTGPVLVNLWATWCVPCVAELTDIKNNEQSLRDHGLEVVALSVDGLDENDDADVAEATAFMTRLGFPFKAGAATPVLLDKLDALQEVLISLRVDKGQLPSSFLIDRFGRLAVIYRGAVTAEQLLTDVKMLASDQRLTRAAAFPLAGRWSAMPHEMGELLVEVAREFNNRGYRDDALRFAGLATDLASRSSVSPKLGFELADMFFAAGNASFETGTLDVALRHYAAAIRLRPDWAEAHTNLGSVYDQLKASDAAEQHYLIALQYDPFLLQANFNLGILRLKQGNHYEAVQYFQTAVEVDPDFAAAHNYLGIGLARLGRMAESIRHLDIAVRIFPANSPAKADAQRNLDVVVSGRVP